MKGMDIINYNNVLYSNLLKDDLQLNDGGVPTLVSLLGNARKKSALLTLILTVAHTIKGREMV